MSAIEKITRYLNESNRLDELKPVGGEDSGALKFVFKLPKEGTVTCEFLDGTKTEVNVDPEDKSAGRFAFVGKDHGNIFQTWDKKPSREEAHDVLARLKSPKHGKVKESKTMDITKKINNYLKEENKIDWKDVWQALVATAEEVFGDDYDVQKVEQVYDAVKEKNPKDTEDAIGIGQGMLRAGS